MQTISVLRRRSEAIDILPQQTLCYSQEEILSPDRFPDWNSISCLFFFLEPFPVILQ